MALDLYKDQKKDQKLKNAYWHLKIIYSSSS